jgi:glycosyltransferase involved in cell wall biosynthesis
MRVLVMAHLFPPAHNAGAERMLLAMLQALTARGHTVDVALSQPHDQITEPYSIGGIAVHPRRDSRDPYRYLADCDVIVTHLENTKPASLFGQMYGIATIHVCHNTFPETAAWLRRGGPALAVYNSRWMAETFAGIDVRSIVIAPPIFSGDYATTPGDAITLINLFESKGAGVFYALAERFPKQRFLGVKGAYGHQDVRELPNVEILDHIDGDHMAAKVYSRTRVLLMPSIYESYGRVALEAACSGIPTIAAPTPGLRESLGDAGHFAACGDVDAWEKALLALLDGRRWRAASVRALRRASMLAPAADLDLWCDTVEEIADRQPAGQRLAAFA